MCLTLFIVFAVFVQAKAEERATNVVKGKPNIILILADDLGYGDLGVYGSTHIKTPHLDRMAKEGLLFTQFYTASSVCSPSRAAFLTGKYPQRAGLPICPSAPKRRAKKSLREFIGLHPDEVTIAEVLKSQGYATLCVGKWHLGNVDVDTFHPMSHGFDEYYGVPQNYGAAKRLVDGRQVVAQVAKPTQFTEDYTKRVIDFITRKRDTPFFVYLPHNFPHVPYHPHTKFKGTSKAGDYGDVIQEIDASTGKILAKLKSLGIDKNTMVVFTSDNGPLPNCAKRYRSSGALSGSKYSTHEGGQRVPCVVRWPGKLTPNRKTNELATAMDWFPTFTRLAGARLPADELDGHDLWPILIDERGAKSPHEVFYYYNETHLQAVRWKNWKLHLPRVEKQIPYYQRHHKLGFRKLERPFLVDLATDFAERNNLATEQPEVVKEIQKLADRARRQFGDYQKPGVKQRPLCDHRNLSAGEGGRDAP